MRKAKEKSKRRRPYRSRIDAWTEERVSSALNFTTIAYDDFNIGRTRCKYL
jgi:hypothetical protein